MKKSGYWKRQYDDAAGSANRFQTMLMHLMRTVDPDNKGITMSQEELTQILLGQGVITYDLNQKQNTITLKINEVKPKNTTGDSRE